MTKCTNNKHCCHQNSCAKRQDPLPHAAGLVASINLQVQIEFMQLNGVNRQEAKGDAAG